MSNTDTFATKEALRGAEDFARALRDKGMNPDAIHAMLGQIGTIAAGNSCQQLVHATAVLGSPDGAATDKQRLEAMKTLYLVGRTLAGLGVHLIKLVPAEMWPMIKQINEADDTEENSDADEDVKDG